MNRRILFIILGLSLSLSSVFSQGIEGKVVDIEGNTVSYASIFIKELSRGTTSNSMGMFSLPLPAGDYTIFFRSLGYTEVIKKVSVKDRMITLDIQMPPQSYIIPEVIVSASGEDPAYRVMRKAIGLANYHLNQVSTYNAEVYIKGTAYFYKLPKAVAKRIQVGDVQVKENKAYMLESINDVNYRAPDKYDMRVVASQNTIPGYVENVNPMDYINASLYQQQIETFVSPLARNAFFYYNFSFESSFLQGNYMIDKIRVIPKRKSQQLCSGYLYIVEDLWCIHSSDLAVNTIAGTLFLQQQYANVIMDAWLPVSHKLQMEVEIAGVQADVTYVSSLEYKSTVLNANLPRSYFEPQTKPEEEIEEAPPSEEQEKIQEILEKDELNDRDMARLTRLMEKETDKAAVDSNKLEVEGTKFSIAPNAVMNDSSYWNARRPVPLTQEEKITIAVRDSVMGFGSRDTTEMRSDSARVRKRRPVKTFDIINGRLYQSNNRKLKLTHGGLLDANMFTFNSVDGWIYGQNFVFDYRPTRRVAYRWNLKAQYAFNRKAPFITWTSSILYLPEMRGRIALRMNYHSADFNHETGIPNLTNAAYSLLTHMNYSRRYERRSAQLEHRMDLATGFVFTASLNYEDRRQLSNNTNFSLIKRDSSYAENVPDGFDVDNRVFDDSKLLAAEVRLEYTHDYYYRLRNGRKIYFKSDYPTLFAVYKHSIPVETNGWADYRLIYGGLIHNREVGLLSELNYRLEGGYYIRSNNMHFSDYAHFKSSPLMFDMLDFTQSYQLLDYYEASTDNYYVIAHVMLTSPYMILKMLPWFSERLWNESLSVAYLNTPGVSNYLQLGYSLNEIGFLLDIGVYTAIEDWKYRGTALKINFRF